jgi:ferritin-like metal-binding protein YciE
MTVDNPKDVFVQLLSDIRQGTEITTEFFEEISQVTQHPSIKEAMEARVFLAENMLANLDQCFKLIGEKPVDSSGYLTEVIFEDFHKDLADIQNPAARHLFILAKVNHLVHLRIAEYVTLIAAADIAGHFGVGVLLETCLADKLAFVERTRHLIRSLTETKVAASLAA